ncbi:pyrroloquinoline quinone biosynthesis protein PqqF [Pseudomonas putida]
MPDASRHLTLANGLHLTLRHAPRLKRAAAALRVHAGSHDAPEKWPGLAHFLEHLFFLETPRLPHNDGLMRYVQALGGQVNASTRERSTDFFFEVPPAALAGGLERLCQMLVEVDLGMQRQQREREVIHAEFIAWSRNREAQRQFALLQSVSAQHPLSGFHAGNRFTLTLQAPAFQRALALFHQRFYQGGQITLSLCGPQPLDDLQRLGTQFAGLFAAGQRIPQTPPPALLAKQRPLIFAHEHLPAGAEQALRLLLAWLGDSRPGGLLDALRQRNWLQGFKAEPLYAFAGQLLWHIDLQLSADACAEQAHALLLGWLGFLQQADQHQLNAQYARLQQRREQAASPLELARSDSAGEPFEALDGQGQLALKALFDSLPCRDHGHWRLPEADALLINDLPPASGRQLPAAVAVCDLLPASRECAALYLRWHIPSPLRQRLQHIIEQALRPLLERAERAALQLHFSAAGEYWQLRCVGLPAAVIRAIGQALRVLAAPAANAWQTSPPQEPAAIPIRALLKQLPDALLGSDSEPQPACTIDQQLFDAVLQQARWHGLALGFDDPGLRALAAALQGCPGEGATAAAPPAWQGRRWAQANVAGSENALLLFCPLPPARQASGRLLAHLLQGPVYQRLRVELQLGYAVFSAFRQIEGCAGLLFGVQSPTASHAEILGHLHALLERGANLDPAGRQALAEQFDEPAMANAEAAEWAWQTHLATQPVDLHALRRSILNTQQADLDDLLRDLLHGQSPWLCLANTAEPDGLWF